MDHKLSVALSSRDPFQNDTIRYDTRCCSNMRSKADMSRARNQQLESGKQKN